MLFESEDWSHRLSVFGEHLSEELFLSVHVASVALAVIVSVNGFVSVSVTLSVIVGVMESDLMESVIASGWKESA